MKASEFNTKSSEDLNKEILELTRERFNLRMQMGTGQLTKPHQLRNVRRNLARIKTLLNQRSAKS